MTLRSLKLAAILPVILVPACLSAQMTTTASEDERIEQLVRSEASEWYTPKNSVTVGFRLLTSGANVRFGNLGSIGAGAAATPPVPGSPTNRVYDNGYVNVDAPLAGEMDANGNQTSIPGFRYQTYTKTTKPITDADGKVIGEEIVDVLTADRLSYTPGQTRSWGYSTPGQAEEMPGYIAMSTYSATSEGASLSNKEGPSAGIELQFAHAMRKLGKRTELSFVAGMALNGINNTISGDVRSTLHTHTDYYNLHGLPAPETSLDKPYKGPIFPDGITETTTPIGGEADPSLSTNTPTAGGATVHGRWQIKGAYFMMRLGPSVRTQVTERLGLSASIGLAAAYAGTHFSSEETMEVPVIGTIIKDTVTDSDATKFLTGYYADFNVEWATNETLGVFGGVSAQRFGDYTQVLGDRSALIDLGNAIGIRGGVNIKF